MCFCVNFYLIFLDYYLLLLDLFATQFPSKDLLTLEMIKLKKFD